MSCTRFREDVVGLLEGSAAADLRDHVASCDACRDASHDLTTLAAKIAHAGDDFVMTSELAARLEEVARSATPRERTSMTRLRAAEQAPSKRPRKKLVALVLAAACSVTASAALGVVLADRQRSPEALASKPWRGKISKISRSGADKAGEGFFVVTSSGKTPLAEGGWVKAGMRVATDAKTRVRIDMDDGSFLVLDRASEVSVEDAPRTLKIADGAVLADVAHVNGAPWAKIKTAHGDVKILGTKLAVTATADRTNVEVLRGEVEIATGTDSHKVGAGQEGVASKDGKVDVAPANDLAQRAAFGEQLIATHNEDAEAPASGLGELRAKKPGQQNEKDRAVRLAKHDVKIRIAGNVARTEIDETFANDTEEELEGIFRFPLPPAAQIERLALEVDGKLLDGEFLDKAKASAIWRGAIQQAAPQIRQREEIFWVPGPWHDPALLEWQRGGRFELRIFPIPKHGARRVVIAYTETVAPVSGIRRYIYPLPQGSSSKITVDNFAVDAQVVGHADKTPVRVRGYELDRKNEGAAERFTGTMASFTPSGDLAIEYSLDDKTTDATTWAFAAPPVPADPKAKEKDPIGDDPFVAIALRPKLPNWSEGKARDQVIVVDSGRAMFGERFQRAKRLAVQMAQEMDRRDRVSVLACDVTCRAMPGGFVAPGAPSAHDVDAFLAGVTPDGATDLVGAVRAASKANGRDTARDLRVVVVSDGVSTAGFRNPARVATEAADALGDARASVVTVPIGADADTTLLAELARGGGGVVVPYQPGQRLEASALEILNATYGTTLRDVELVLPEGLRDVAPSALPPLRAGSESIVTARMSRDAVKGEIVLRGKVGGDPFEAKYAIDVKSTTDAANAFVPRLFAAARIADREREPGDASRSELVALSRRFAVPSRHTSLLVLESEAMFKAFGIERTQHAPLFTGENAAVGTLAYRTSGPANVVTGGDDLHALAADEPAEAREKKDISGQGRGGGGSGSGFGLGSLGAAPPAKAARPAPAPTAAAPAQEAPPPPATASKRRSLDSVDPFSSPGDFDDFRRGRPGRFMKKIFVRHGSIATDATPPIAADKVEKARAAVAAAPDERGKHKELAKVLALSGQLEELGETLEKWSARDPLDADVIVGRADLAARKGDREASLRILSGALAASALSTEDAAQIASNVARSFERLGRPEACAFRVTAAEIKPQDNDVMARAVACERNQGRAKSAERWLSVMKEARRKVVETAAAKIDPAKPDGQGGDIVVTASWDGGADLDVAILDPAGRRAGVASRMRGTRVEAASSRDHETVALASGEGGTFVVEVVRASLAESTTPVSGRMTVRAFGQTQTVPFTLTGARMNVARVEANWVAELVPVDDDSAFGVTNFGPQPFDRAAAAGALSAVSVAHCGASGQVGTGHLTVTFAPTGRVSEVVVDDANFAGTPAGRCARAAFFNAVVTPFAGGPVRIGKSFTIR